MDTGLKCETDHSAPPSVKLTNTAELYSHSPICPNGVHLNHFTLLYFILYFTVLYTMLNKAVLPKPFNCLHCAVQPSHLTIVTVQYSQTI